MANHYFTALQILIQSTKIHSNLSDVNILHITRNSIFGIDILYIHHAICITVLGKLLRHGWDRFCLSNYKDGKSPFQSTSYSHSINQNWFKSLWREHCTHKSKRDLSHTCCIYDSFRHVWDPFCLSNYKTWQITISQHFRFSFNQPKFIQIYLTSISHT
jgi:hypothetical protein